MLRQGPRLADKLRMAWSQRRFHPRLPIRVEAAYEDAERQVFLETRDISEEGIYLFSPDPPDVGCTARLVLDLPGSPEMLRLSGRVLRRDLGARSGFVVLFQHGEQDPVAAKTRKVLRDLVNTVFRCEGEFVSP